MSFSYNEPKREPEFDEVNLSKEEAITFTSNILSGLNPKESRDVGAFGSP